MTFKRQADMIKMDHKISELHSRLSRKRQLNEQMMANCHVNSQKAVDNCGQNGVLVPPLPPSQPPPTSTTSTANLKGLNASSTLNESYKSTSMFVDHSDLISSESNDYFMDSSQASSVDNNNLGCSANANNISLIINGKHDSLEERPSPSGSSGSSDRISSSINSYSYLASNNNSHYYNHSRKQSHDYELEYSSDNCNLSSGFDSIDRSSTNTYRGCNDSNGQLSKKANQVDNDCLYISR